MKALGIFRGFPGLGRVVSGIALMETLRDKFMWEIEMISYLQGNAYLRSKGYIVQQEVSSFDYCSIGLLPTNKMGEFIHNHIRTVHPDVVLIDGEPLILQSLRISYPKLKIIALLNPSDVNNPLNNKEAMDFFNEMYTKADLAIVHGIQAVKTKYSYESLISVNTILRPEVLNISNFPIGHIYCVLGGGTVNVDDAFTNTTLTIAKHYLSIAKRFPTYKMHIVCSNYDIYHAVSKMNDTNEVILHDEVLSPAEIYSNANLIITRSGRNSLSELAYLGIPAISFVSGCSYRIAEQKQNIANLSAPNIATAPLEISTEALYGLCLQQIGQRYSTAFKCGNDEAIIAIQQLLNP